MNMPWNGPINGDYSNCDWSKGPWGPTIMELTHDEVIFVKDSIAQFEEVSKDELFIISRYNELTVYEKAINGATYNVIKVYDPDINKLGINEDGIVVEIVEEPPSEEGE